MSSSASERCGGRWRLALMLAMLAAAGCGLADYEAKQEEAQKQLDLFDKFKKDFEEPLRMPEAAKENDWPDVFLLPPKGLATTPDDTPFKGLFYFYSSKGGNDAKVARLYLGWAGKEKDFRATVLKWFGKGKVATYRTVPRDEREPIKLERITVQDKAETFFIYFGPRQQVVLIFQVPQSTAEPPTVVRESLNTLALGREARDALREYKKRFKDAHP